MTAQAAAARLLFGMARDGRLPRALAVVDPRHGVPRASLITTASLTLAVSLWAARRDDGLEVLVSIVDVGALAAFTMLHVSVLGYFAWQRRGAARAAHYVVPVLGAIVTLWVIAEASALAQIVGAAWLLLAAMVLAVGRARE
jgi:amino acid transporter